MRKIKIVRIIARLNIGGPAINAVLLSEGLNQDSYKTHLLIGNVEKGEGDMSYFARERDVDIIVIPQLGRRLSPLRDLKALCTIYRIIKSEQPDIVHTHTAKAGALGRISAALAGVPVRVHTFHGHIFDGYFNAIISKIFVMVERVLSNLTTKIILVTNSLIDDISIKYSIAPKSKVEVIPLGFELERFFGSERFRGRLKRELGLAPDTLLIGMVGRLVPVKNHRMFFEVVRKLKIKNEKLKIKFIIVGDGELRKELEEYAKAIGVAEEVIFLGWRRDLDVIYADLDIVCLTSLNEGTPVSLIEAMASGKPVVTTDVGGVRDVVQDKRSGILVPGGDVERFSKAILELLQDRLKRIEMGNCGKEFVRINFTKERLFRNTQHLYKSLLKEKGIL